MTSLHYYDEYTVNTHDAHMKKSLCDLSQKFGLCRNHTYRTADLSLWNTLVKGRIAMRFLFLNKFWILSATKLARSFFFWSKHFLTRFFFGWHCPLVSQRLWLWLGLICSGLVLLKTFAEKHCSVEFCTQL